MDPSEQSTKESHAFVNRHCGLKPAKLARQVVAIDSVSAQDFMDGWSRRSASCTGKISRRYL